MRCSSSRRLSLLGLALSLALGIIASTLAHPAVAAPPKHLADAVDLVSHLDLAHTDYDHGQGTIKWDGARESHTDCSGFLDLLFMHSYGYTSDDYKKWMGSHRPTAARYHDAIEKGEGFEPIEVVSKLQPGDILAVKYFTRKDNTGHVMLVADAPRKITPHKPLVAGTEQWEVTVIDSSKTGHGKTDTRHARGASGKDHDGLGEGVLRLYSSPGGKLAGFAWSTLEASDFKNPQEEHIVGGRLKK